MKLNVFILGIIIVFVCMSCRNGKEAIKNKINLGIDCLKAILDTFTLNDTIRIVLDRNENAGYN